MRAGIGQLRLGKVRSSRTGRDRHVPSIPYPLYVLCPNSGGTLSHNLHIASPVLRFVLDGFRSPGIVCSLFLQLCNQIRSYQPNSGGRKWW